VTVTAIRESRADEGDVLREIERQAGWRFREVGLPEVADAEPLSREELAAYARDGRSWVAVDGRDEPLGYVLVDIVDGQSHIEQLSVRPDHQGQGFGRALCAHVGAWTRQRGMRAVTLTTFAHVPWNRPLYEHLGFVVLARGATGPELSAIVVDEALHGLDPAQRVCMQLDLPG
jgi:GNAT superfamily N-acetyltransferase